jgi:hypothetical protein
MFARSVSFRLKPDSIAAFTKLIEDETLPLLRKQKGFQDQITFVVPGGRDAVGISLWDRKESAEAYNCHGYPDVLKALRNLVEGTPQVQTYQVANSTFHKIAARIAA